MLRATRARSENGYGLRPGLETGVKNYSFWSAIGSGFGEPAGKPPPRITRMPGVPPQSPPPRDATTGFPGNDVLETSAENPYCMMTRHYQELGSASGWFKFVCTYYKHYPDLGSDASAERRSRYVTLPW